MTDIAPVVHEYGGGTSITTELGMNVGARVLCADGRVRAVRAMAREQRQSDGIAAVLPIHKKRVSGLVVLRTITGNTTGTTDRPLVAMFVASSTSKNAALLPGVPWEETS